MANGETTEKPPAGTKIRAALEGNQSFLSYAAGLMTAAEIAKLALTGRSVTRNRVFFEPRTSNLVRVVALGRNVSVTEGTHLSTMALFEDRDSPCSRRNHESQSVRKPLVQDGRKLRPGNRISELPNMGNTIRRFP